MPNFINHIEESNWVQNVIVIGALLKTVITGLILMLFISKKNYALRIIIIYEVFCILIRILTYIDFYSRGQIVPSSYHVSILFGVISVLWISYFLKSNRAKETFINS